MSLEHYRAPPQPLLLGAEHDHRGGRVDVCLDMVQKTSNERRITISRKVIHHPPGHYIGRVVGVRQHALSGSARIDVLRQNPNVLKDGDRHDVTICVRKACGRNVYSKYR